MADVVFKRHCKLLSFFYIYYSITNIIIIVVVIIIIWSSSSSWLNSIATDCWSVDDIATVLACRNDVTMTSRWAWLSLTSALVIITGYSVSFGPGLCHCAMYTVRLGSKTEVQQLSLSLALCMLHFLSFTLLQGVFWVSSFTMSLNQLIHSFPSYVTNQPPKANSAFHPCGIGKWIPASAGKENESFIVHSVSGWTRGVQIKLWDPLRTRAIPERFTVVFMTRCYKSTFTLPYLISAS